MILEMNLLSYIMKCFYATHNKILDLYLFEICFRFVLRNNTLSQSTLGQSNSKKKISNCYF